MRKALALLVVLVPASAWATGEEQGGFPNWAERVIHEWMNRARSAPQVEMTACGAACGEKACYAAVGPIWYSEALNHAARYPLRGDEQADLLRPRLGVHRGLEHHAPSSQRAVTALRAALASGGNEDLQSDLHRLECPREAVRSHGRPARSSPAARDSELGFLPVAVRELDGHDLRLRSSTTNGHRWTDPDVERQRRNRLCGTVRGRLLGWRRRRRKIPVGGSLSAAGGVSGRLGQLV